MKYRINEKTVPQASHLNRILGLLLSSISIWLPLALFILLAYAIGGNKPVFGDTALLRSIHRLSSHTLDSIMKAVTDLGDVSIIVPLVLVTSGLLVYRKRLNQALFLVCSIGSTAALNVVCKHIFRRDRPQLWQHLVHETSFSFPSGHAMASSALAIAVVLIFWQSRFRVPALITSGSYVLVVGFSRLYLGVHYPSDVLAGWSASATIVSTSFLIFKRYQRNPSDIGNK